jgi:flagella basal body P-ring formation protein FlgA
MMIKFRVQSSGFRVQEPKKAMSNERKILMIICLAFVLCLPSSIFPFFSAACCASEYSTTEVKIISFIRGIYNDSDDVQVRLNAMPNQLKENTKVKNITFMRVPDANGDGICAVEIDTRASRNRNVHVPFRVFIKRKLFVLKAAGKKDEAVRKGDVIIKETYMNGKGEGHPASLEDVAGKILKRDVPANTVITYQMLEEPVAIQRGEVVNIVVESKNLLVLVKGKTIDKGKVGDTVRVKNISSGKEILGRVTAHNTVAIDF